MMTARAWRSQSKSAAYDFADDDYSAHWEITPGERVCPPSVRSRGRAFFRLVLFLLLVLGGYWAVAGDRGSWSEWLQIASAIMSQPSEPEPEPAEQQTAFAGAPQLAEPPQQELVEIPATISAPEPASDPTASENAVTESEQTARAEAPDEEETATSEAASEPLPPPTADPDDPYQARALAVGLHPGLSRVLLMQLSPADYRNAGIAIRTAIAETPDTGTYVYPRQRKPDHALFRVHFVRGAAPNCRRYVVTVTKKGWSTTALPMEKCGERVAQRRAG